MRILHVLHDVDDVGNGIINAAIDLATHQQSLGHDVAVAAGRGSFTAMLRERGVGFYALPLRMNAGEIALAGFRFRSVVRRFAPDVVHAHVPAAAILARAFRLGSPYRVVATAHRVYDPKVRVLGLADVVIALSAANRDALQAAGIAGKKLRIVNNGVIGTFRSANGGAAAAQLEHPAIVTVGGLFLRKGIDLLIGAFGQIAEKHPNAQLYIVGEGPDRRTFTELAARQSSADRIHFVGFSNEAKRYLRAADVFVLASRREAFPLALLEARELGCAIVATDVDGAREALGDGAAGMLVSSDDTRGLALAIDAMLSDAVAAAAYRVRARSDLGLFSAERMARETLGAYERERSEV